MNAGRSPWKSCGLAVLILALSAGGPAAKESLTAQKVKTAPKIDGKSEREWNRVRPVKIDLPGKFAVTARAVYTDTHVFFLFQWPDKEESLNRIYILRNGTWQKEKGNEDRFNLLWSIGDSIAGFNEKGCQIACHKNRESGEGEMYTNGPTERGDLWHWKSQRTNPLGYADDQVLTHEVDRSGDEATGRRSDSQSGGGYGENWDEGKKHPKFAAANGKGGPALARKDAKAVSDATSFREGTVVPREVLELPKGSRGDIAAMGTWSKGKWTLEMGRKLETGHDDDIQFDDLGKPYHFGISVHNNAGGDTHATSEVIELTFK
jgi:hypothetical protein